MQWKTIDRNWSRAVDGMVQVMPNADKATLEGLRGRHERVIGYLAKAHDLTRAETRDMLETLLEPQSLRPVLHH